MMRLHFIPADRPPRPGGHGKLADAEIHFGDHTPLAGLKLTGLAVWQRGIDRYVALPARGVPASRRVLPTDHRYPALLRPVAAWDRADYLTGMVLAGYADYELADTDTDYELLAACELEEHA